MTGTVAPEPVIVVCGIALAVAAACAATLAAVGVDLRPRLGVDRRLEFVEREKDLAAGLGLSWRRWLALRVVALAACLALGAWTGVPSLTLLLALVAVFGLRFAVAGRAARRRLRMERTFIAQLRALRDRMAVANQSLDTALQEIGRSPLHGLENVLAPLGRGGSTRQNIVDCGVCSRSAIVEQACAILLWARTRSVDALIDALDEVLLPVGEAQLAVEEETLVTLTQQRAVTFAMAGLLLFMFVTIVRVDAFRSYYQTPGGTVVLLVAVGLFFALVSLLGRIVRVTPWTRWILGDMAAQEADPRG